MTTGKYELVIKWPSGQSTLWGEMTDHQHGEICRILSPDYRAQLDSLKSHEPAESDDDALLARMCEKYENAHAMAQALIAERKAQRAVIERTIDRLEHGHEHNKALIELRALLGTGGA